MNKLITLNYIGKIAQQCSLLRQEGLYEQADQLQKELEELVKSSDGIHTGMTRGDLL